MLYRETDAARRGEKQPWDERDDQGVVDEAVRDGHGELERRRLGVRIDEAVARELLLEARDRDGLREHEVCAGGAEVPDVLG